MYVDQCHIARKIIPEDDEPYINEQYGQDCNQLKNITCNIKRHAKRRNAR